MKKLIVSTLILLVTQSAFAGKARLCDPEEGVYVTCPEQDPNYVPPAQQTPETPESEEPAPPPAPDEEFPSV